jgi:hypothetical protein
MFKWHKKYFVMNRVNDISDALMVYGKKERLRYAARPDIVH